MKFRIPDTIPRTAWIEGASGEPAAAIAAALTGHGFTIAARADAGTQGVLINLPAPLPPEQTDWTDADLRPSYRLIEAFAARVPEDAEGVAINFLDRGVWSLMPHAVPWSVAKAGLWRLTQTMALAHAPRVRINAIGSGPILGGTAPADPYQVARAVLAILAFRSMTGQMIVPDGAPAQT